MRLISPLCLSLVLGLALSSAWAAQAPPAEATPAAAYATGDAWIDRQLEDIDAYARRYPSSFADELGRNLGVRRAYAEAVLAVPGWRAGDLYFACAWAQVSGQGCRELVRARSQALGKPWEALLSADGKPDNLAYRAVRHAIVASYDRWDRPITLDARLREQLGDAAARLERDRAAYAPEPPAREH